MLVLIEKFNVRKTFGKTKVSLLGFRERMGSLRLAQNTFCLNKPSFSQKMPRRNFSGLVVQKKHGESAREGRTMNVARATSPA